MVLESWGRPPVAIGSSKAGRLIKQIISTFYPNENQNFHLSQFPASVSVTLIFFYGWAYL